MTTNISLLNKENCVVTVIETILPIQEMYIDALMDLGYKSLTPFSDLNLFIRHVQSEHVDWCILSLEHIGTVKLSELINNLYKVSKNPAMLISIINRPEERIPLILSAYEQGILSHFSKPSFMDEFEDQIKSLLKLIEQHKGNYCFVAAEYIRQFLKEKKFYKSLLQLEKSILGVYPGTPRSLIMLAEAFCLNKNFELATKTLAQAEFIDPSVKELGLTVSQKYISSEDLARHQQNNILGLENCVIVDPDTDVQYYVTETLKKLGVQNCVALSDGLAAVDYLSNNPEPNIIIMEWKVPFINGIALVQRIRKMGLHHCYLMVISSLIKETEHPLLQEVGVDTILEKPFDGTKLTKELIGIVQRHRRPLEQAPMERKIRTLIAMNHMSEAFEMLQEYINRPLISQASKEQMHAEYEYAIGSYSVACNFALNALKISSGSILLYSLLGRCFLKLKDFKNATKSFEKAHQLSPTNIDRILLLVDLKQEEGKKDEAKKLLEDAKNVDATRTDVVEMECRIAIQNNDGELAKQLLKTLNSLTGVVGMINNDAVSKIRAGQFDEGVKLYQQALNSLPLDSKETQEFITYNLALAYARQGDTAKCLEILNSIEVDPKGKIAEKYKAFKVRVKHAVMHNASLELKSSEQKESAENNKETPTQQLGNIYESIEKQMEFKKGSRCCYKIYTRSEKGEL